MAVVVMTTIPVRPGVIDEVARLFEETNPALVADQAEWLGATFTGNRERSEITNRESSRSRRPRRLSARP
ncbi:MAG: hypothetical protein ACLGI8_05935 [Acidimicrobiia bacterium]